MVLLKNMVVGRVYRVRGSSVAFATATGGWLWIWEGKNDGDVGNEWPILKSIVTGAEEAFAPREMEAADELVKGQVYRLRDAGIEFTGEDHGWLWIYAGMDEDFAGAPRNYFKSVATGRREWLPVLWLDLD